MPLPRVLPLILLVVLCPLAVAGQNIGSGVILLLLLSALKSRWASVDGPAFWREYRVPVLAAVAYLTWGWIAGALNPASSEHLKVDFIGGYLVWAFMAPLAYLALAPLSPDEIKKLKRVFAGVAVVWGQLAIAQALFGFKLSGMHFESEIKRAQGLYSHPLSFAYAVMLLVPFGWFGILRHPKDRGWWCVLFGGLAGVYASQSRTVQVVIAGMMALSALKIASGKMRAAAVAILVVGGALFAFTDNLMKDRFVRTLHGNFDVQSSYPDDRLAFWDAHWLMFKDRPLIGHGENLTMAYRTPYYDQLGLQSLARKYPAHNMFLQIAVNQGVVGLMIFTLWFGWYIRRAWRTRRANLYALPALAAMITFALAAVTQNAFQDAVVRFVLTMVMGGLWFVRDDAAVAATPEAAGLPTRPATGSP